MNKPNTSNGSNNPSSSISQGQTPAPANDAPVTREVVSPTAPKEAVKEPVVTPAPVADPVKAPLAAAKGDDGVMSQQQKSS